MEEGSAASSARLFSDVIRLWAICDKKLVDAAVGRIYQSYMRGTECLLRKRLRGLDIDRAEEIAGASSTRARNIIATRLPTTYTEKMEDESPKGHQRKRKNTDKSAEVEQELVVPAMSARGGANRHTMKFYDFDANLARSLLQQRTQVFQDNTDTASSAATTSTSFMPDQKGGQIAEIKPGTFEIEFPFRLTEMEYMIVNMRPVPEEPILLLGRSGTGKTTCCLYRMFSQFLTYWYRAIQEGGPFLARPVERPRRNPQFQLENQTDTTENGDSGMLHFRPLEFLFLFLNTFVFYLRI